MEGVTAQSLFHLAQQRVQRLDRLHHITHVGARGRLDVGEVLAETPPVCRDHVVERQGRQGVQTVLCLDGLETAQLRAQLAMTMLHAGCGEAATRSRWPVASAVFRDEHDQGPGKLFRP